MPPQSSTRLRIAAVCLFAAVFMRVSSAHADDRPESGSVGISALVQSSQLDLLLPIWSGDRFVIAPTFSVISVGSAFTDIGFGALFRIYFRGAKAAPYLGARASVLTLRLRGGSAVDCGNFRR